METPNFSNFRLGTPVTLTSGATLSYQEVQGVELPDFYIRKLHKAATSGKVTRGQIDDWLKRAAAADRRTVQQVKAEIKALEPAPPPPPKTTPTGVRRRKPSEKLITLVSKGNHKRAVKVAQGYNLIPVPVAAADLRPGQSSEAHTVQAVSHLAGKLITTGNWATR